MAATNTPLVWDFYRAVPAAEGLGSVVEYYDEASQSLYLASGLKTQLATVEDGHWSEAEPGPEITISSETFTASAWDHPITGQLYGAAIIDGELVFLRYLYAKELSQILKAGSWKARNDSQITQMSLRLLNAGEDYFLGPASLFTPGARITAAVSMGGSVPYKIGEAYLDEFDFDAHAADVSLSGRNNIGFRLNSQTFDENTSYTGTGKQVVEWIFGLAGITKYHIGASDASNEWVFEPDDTYIKGLDKVFEVFVGWALIELPDGTLCVGYPYDLAEWQVNSVYQFHGGTDVFKRKTKKNADAAYSKVRVTGKDASGNDLTPVQLSVSNFSHWSVGVHKTKHVKAADGLTQAELQAYAEQLRDELQYIGQGETFEGPMRPWLLVGDVASVTYDGVESTDLGLVTSITHSFGGSGFFTSFAVDSGGVATPQTRDGTVYATRSAAVNGYNRRQNLADLIGVMGGGRPGKDGAPGTPGTPGEQGPPGQDGQSAAITGASASATTLAAGAPATVQVTAGGTDLARTFAFSFGIPQGAQGSPGPQGETVYNLFVEDSVTSAMYQVIVESGRLELLEVTTSVNPTEITLIDTVTGTAYILGAASGRIILTEV